MKLRERLSLFFFGFYIICNESNNKKKKIQEGELNLDIYFKPPFGGNLPYNVRSYKITVFPIE